MNPTDKFAIEKWTRFLLKMQNRAHQFLIRLICRLFLSIVSPMMGIGYLSIEITFITLLY